MPELSTLIQYGKRWPLLVKLWRATAGPRRFTQRGWLAVQARSRRARILAEQWALLRRHSRRTTTLIVFLAPGFDWVNGGIRSICSLVDETMRLRHVHGAEVLMCTVPGDPLLLRYTKFANNNSLFHLRQVLTHFRCAESLILHVPEYCIAAFLANLSPVDKARIGRIAEVHVNVLLQNIALISGQPLDALRGIGRVTATTAHERYSSLALRQQLGIPLHTLSTCVSPEQYVRRPYEDKEDLMVISADQCNARDAVMECLRSGLPHVRLQVIRNMTYEQYKRVIERAKWAITFGEGLDGYFVETIFSGGVSFAVYNDDFFTADFSSLDTVYDSYESLAERIAADVMRLDRRDTYERYQERQFALCAKYYNFEQYVSNLARFYEGEYTYP